MLWFHNALSSGVLTSSHQRVSLSEMFPSRGRSRQYLQRMITCWAHCNSIWTTTTWMWSTLNSVRTRLRVWLAPPWWSRLWSPTSWGWTERTRRQLLSVTRSQCIWLISRTFTHSKQMLTIHWLLVLESRIAPRTTAQCKHLTLPMWPSNAHSTQQIWRYPLLSLTAQSWPLIWHWATPTQLRSRP